MGDTHSLNEATFMAEHDKDDLVDKITVENYKGRKKPKGSVPSGIPLDVDLAEQKVLMPVDLYRRHPDYVMFWEESLIKEVLEKAVSK